MPTTEHDAHDRARATMAMSIVIGTLNRCELLERSLRSLMAQRCPADRFEILVVDNGSTDGTLDLLEALSREATNLRVVKEPKRGLSNARNRGIAEARADLIGFFDDDAVAEPDWVDVLLRVFETEPEAGAAGGRIFVLWPGPRPDWMPVSIEGYYGRCDYGSERKYLRYPEYPFGSNMVIRRERLLAINGFNTQLGPTGGNLMAGGEQDLFYRLYQTPIRVVYDPAAVVHHWAPPERVTKKWCLRRAFRHGMSNATMTFSNGETGFGVWSGKLAFASGQTVVGAVSTAVAWVSRAAPSVVVSRGANTCYWAGIARAATSNAFRRAQ
jgi:glycosyltransferase involved in cell wall biosynthesis